MKRIASFLIALVLTTPSFAEVANKVIVRVNDRIATLYDFEERYQVELRRLEEQPEDEVEGRQAAEEAARHVMRTLFEELLILSRADQLGIFITEGEVEEQIQRMREQNGLESDEDFAAALAQAGMSREQINKQFEQNTTWQRVMGREVYSDIAVKEEDLRRYYRDHIDDFRTPEEVSVREIVVLDDGSASTQAEALAAQIVGDLRSGKTLEEVAAAGEDGQLSGVIDLGWVGRGDLDGTLETALWSLESGEYSEPTRARGGVHIALVAERRESVIKPFKEVEEVIERQQQGARNAEKIKEYLVELEEKSYLFLDPPPEAAGFRTSSGETPLNVDFAIFDPAAAEDP